MAAQPSDWLVFAGTGLIALAVSVVLIEAVLQSFNNRGLVQGAVPKRPGETLREHRQRNLDYDNREISALKRWRPISIALGLVGTILLVIGIVA